MHHLSSGCPAGLVAKSVEQRALVLLIDLFQVPFLAVPVDFFYCSLELSVDANGHENSLRVELKSITVIPKGDNY